MIETIKNSVSTTLSGLNKQLEGVSPNENPHPAAMFRFQLEAFSRRLDGELVPGAVFSFFHPITLREEAFVVLNGPDTVTHTTHGHGMWVRNANPLSDNWSLSKSMTLAKKLGALIAQQEEYAPSVPGFHVLFDPVQEGTPALNYDYCGRHVNTLSKVSYLDVVTTDSRGNVVVPKAVSKASKPATQKAPAKSAEALVAEAEALVAAVNKAKAKGKGKGKAKAKAVAKAAADQPKATKKAAKKGAKKAKATPAKAETKPKKGAKATTKKAAKTAPKARKGKGKQKAS